MIAVIKLLNVDVEDFGFELERSRKVTYDSFKHGRDQLNIVRYLSLANIFQQHLL
jgi:hypothetical protein